jgi:hypothetical protein
MPLPLGPWNVTAGTQVGALTFGVGTGSLSGEIFGVPFVGFFDETSQTLTMLVNPQLISESGFAEVLQTPLTVFQGSLFQFTAAGTSGGSITVSVLTGGFFTGTGTNSLALTTWFAQTPQPVKTSKEGKDGGKDTKDHKDGKEHKDGIKEQIKEQLKELEKLQEVLASAPGFVGSAESVRTFDAGLAIGRSFIEAGDRPAVGEAALQEPRDG